MGYGVRACLMLFLSTCKTFSVKFSIQGNQEYSVLSEWCYKFGFTTYRVHSYIEMEPGELFEIGDLL